MNCPLGLDAGDELKYLWGNGVVMKEMLDVHDV